MRIHMFLLLLVPFALSSARAQPLPGFGQPGGFGEQEMYSTAPIPGVSLVINAPAEFSSNGKTWLVLYALPNGNSIEWTKGKKIEAGEDWHYDIQHIAAQTRFVRQLDRKNNYVVVYLATDQRSWPAWRRQQADSAGQLIRKLVDYTTSMFSHYDPHIVLNGHSGGGSFIFGYLNAYDSVPSLVDRIAFLDSDYGYEDSLHREKLSTWLQKDNKNHLCVLAYNDSVVIYNGKPLVSPTGGTWHRSRKMQRDLANDFTFKTMEDTAFIRHSALKGRISMMLKHNPHGLIYHTVQVERNGFIYSLLFNTKYDRPKYFRYFGDRAYDRYIE